jgi:hypothetical protein
MQDDPRRRPDDYDRQGFGGSVLGPNITPGMMMPFFQGSPNYDFSGIQGQGGLQAFLQSLQQNPGRGFGPAGRHLRNVGQPVEFPGLDTQMEMGPGTPPIGGPNVAPGNPQGLAIGQSNALPPGIQKQQQQLQNTQGWRNLHPGYALAASVGFGSNDPNAGFLGGQGPDRAVGATADAPGPSDRNRGPVQNLGGGGSTGGGGGLRGPGGPALGTGGPPAAGSGGAPGGGGTKPKPGGVTPSVKKQAAGQSTARGGATGGVESTAGIDKTGGGKPKIDPKTGGLTSQGQGVLQGPTAGGPSTQVILPNKGNNNTPSETGPKPKPASAPPAKNFGKDERGTGTAPIVGKKKSASGGGGKPTKGGLAARRA